MTIPDNTIRTMHEFERSFIRTVVALSPEMSNDDIDIALEPVLRAAKSDLYAMNPAELRRAKNILGSISRVVDAALMDSRAALVETSNAPEARQ